MSGTRAQELYDLARYSKVSLPTPKKIPFFLNANDLYVILGSLFSRVHSEINVLFKRRESNTLCSGQL